MDIIGLILVFVVISRLIGRFASENKRKEQGKKREREIHQTSEQPLQPGSSRSEYRKEVDDAWKNALDEKFKDGEFQSQTQPMSVSVSQEEKQRRYAQLQTASQQRLHKTSEKTSENHGGQSFRGSLSGTGDEQSYRGSLGGFSDEGYCPPEHEHGSEMEMTGFSQRRRLPVKIRLNAQNARQAVIMAEILKRPKMGVAPRYR